MGVAMEVVAKNPVVGMKTHGMQKVQIDGLKFSRNKCGHHTTNISLHRYIILKALGYVPDGFDIHHKNFDKDDNLLENLEILTHNEHRKLHHDTDLVEFICQECGNKFLGPKSGRSMYKFCSKKCYHISDNRKAKQIRDDNINKVRAYHRKYSAKYRSKNRIELPIKECLSCKKSFKPRNKRNNCCSRKCYEKNFRFNHKKINEPKECEYCKKLFSYKVNARYCSVKCRSAKYLEDNKDRINLMRRARNARKKLLNQSTPTQANL